MPSLSNHRWERFAQKLAQGLSASAAYVAAGYQRNDSNAARLNGNEQVKGRVAELQARGAEMAGVTLAGITESLMRIAQDAEKDGDAANRSVARAALMDVAKLNGLVVDRSENVTLTHTISGDLLSDEEWEREYAAGGENPQGSQS